MKVENQQSKCTTKQGFLLVGKAREVFAALEALAKLETQMLNLVGLLYGKVIRIEELPNDG